MKVKDLNPADYNPRRISDRQLEMLAKSMREFGDLSGIVFNVRTERLVGGHQRCKQLAPDWKIVKRPHKDKAGTVAAGHIETPFGRLVYREVDWPEEREKAANIAANQHGGEFDDEALRKLIQEINDETFDVDLLGFEQEELDDIIKNVLDQPIEKKKYDANSIIYQILITCKNEDEQKTLTEQLEEEGYQCRILML